MPDLAKFGAQFIQKQRLDEFEDVLFAFGVVRAQVAPCLSVHDAGNRLPKMAGLMADQSSAGVESRASRMAASKSARGRASSKQLAVDVGNRGQLHIKGFAALVFGVGAPGTVAPNAGQRSEPSLAVRSSTSAGRPATAERYRCRRQTGKTTGAPAALKQVAFKAARLLRTSMHQLPACARRRGCSPGLAPGW